MKIIKYFLLIFALICVTCSCSKNSSNDNTIEFNHYVRFGGSEKLKATILWQYDSDAYTKYQVAYTSYVCSDASVNYNNVIYLELTSKGSKEDSIIRNISFSTIDENGTSFNVGLWSDYKEAYGKEFYSEIEKDLLPKLKYMKYSDVVNIDNKGYGGFRNIEGMKEDAISNGTVSANNVISIIKAIFDYHIETHY